MLTMRPLRAFIIPRMTALQVRNTLLRLVSRMSFHSSSFIRISRLSRVMPALLTRMEIAPNSLPMASTSASTAAASVTSSLRPWPPSAARRSPIAAAPESEVAVPITVAPCAASSSAIAAPMPRLAPVTRAISPCNTFVIANSLLPVRQGGFEIGGGTERARVDGLVDALGEAGQDLAGAALGHAGHAAGGQRLHAAGPLHRQVQLAHQRVADRLDAFVHFGIDVLHHRQLRFVPAQRAHGFGQAVRGLA